MSVDDIVTTWKGWWSIPQFDAPLTPQSLVGESSELWHPMAWRVDVTREPVVVEDDFTTPTITVKRSLPSRHRHISIQWSSGGDRFIARGVLGDSLLLAEGMSVYRRVSIDDNHPIIPARTIDNGRNVVAPARDAANEKPLYVVPGIGSAAELAAEQFVSPMTVQLLHMGTPDAQLRVSLDWRRLHHGAGSSMRIAVPQRVRPTVLCVRVLQANGPAFEPQLAVSENVAPGPPTRAYKALSL
jgi:hypothetical protein